MVSYQLKMALVQGIIHRSPISHNILLTSVRKYCTPAPKTLGKKISATGVSKEEKYELPVETNTYTLANYVCGTKLYAETGELVKIKPDSEYPQWLWSMHTGKPKELHELDPNTIEYWKLVRKLGVQTKCRLLSLRQDKRDYK